MISTMLLVALAAAGQVNRGGEIRKEELEYQQEAFRAWWGDELVLKLDDLPTEAIVPEFRIPYAGHDYPDRGGGTVGALSKYDRAYHAGRSMATEFERRDVSGHGSDRPVRRGLFGRIRGPQSSRLVWPLQRLDGGDHPPCRAAAQRDPQRRGLHAGRHQGAAWPKSTCIRRPSSSAAWIARSTRRPCTWSSPIGSAAARIRSAWKRPWAKSSSISRSTATNW